MLHRISIDSVASHDSAPFVSACDFSLEVRVIYIEGVALVPAKVLRVRALDSSVSVRTWPRTPPFLIRATAGRFAER